MENSKIEWTDHTFNPWWGCMKVSEGCKNCYAETLDNRWKGGHWGPNTPRKMISRDYWNAPHRWNRAAQKDGKRAKVFCASMADVFEDHPDVLTARARLWLTILDTPWLDWLLLTKRPENIRRMVPTSWLIQSPAHKQVNWWPENVWIGTSVENQEQYEKRVPFLLDIPAQVRFLSCEPLLGPLSLCTLPDGYGMMPKIAWVIVGGESGPRARPMHPDWARKIRDTCDFYGVPFFFKQWGEYLPNCQLTDLQVTDPKYWPEVEFPSPHNPGKINRYYKAGKKAAGSFIDGVACKQFPNSQPVPNE